MQPKYAVYLREERSLYIEILLPLPPLLFFFNSVSSILQVNESDVLVDGEETVVNCSVICPTCSCVVLEAKACLLRLDIILPALLF